MPAYNPLMGGIVYQAPNGSNPSSATQAIATGALGAAVSSDTTKMGTHWTVAGILLAAIGIIFLVHYAGFRTHFTIGAGD